MKEKVESPNGLQVGPWPTAPIRFCESSRGAREYSIELDKMERSAILEALRAAYERASDLARREAEMGLPDHIVRIQLEYARTIYQLFFRIVNMGKSGSED